MTERLTPADLPRAAALLRAGELVAFPTETVYGLGAKAFDPEAVERIFAAKQRPHWDPLIVHIDSFAMLAQVADASPQARLLMEAFWPGPLTLLLPRAARIPDAVTAGRPLVGVRMPAHPLALELIRQAGVPVAAPSANLFGHTSPTTAAHVLADLDGRIAAVLDGGPTAVGVESTVAGFTGQRELTIYRPGAITAEMLERHFTGHAVEYVPDAADLVSEALPAPGVGLRHYAPRARVILVDRDFARAAEPIELALVGPIDGARSDAACVGVLLPDHWNAASAELMFRWGPWGQPEVLAQRLFEGLRELDDLGASVIVCPLPGPGGGLREAIRDRLRKAAALDTYRKAD